MEKLEKDKKLSTEAETENCVICFDSINDYGAVLPCNHQYHVTCIKDWAKKG